MIGQGDKMKKYMIFSYLVLFLLALMGGCKNTSQNIQTTPFVSTLAIINQAGMPTTTFAQGESVNGIISVTNISLNNQDVLLGGGCSPIIDIYSNNTLIYNDSGMCLTILPTRSTMLPGQTITAPVLWSQKDENGQQVPIGTYNAVGKMPGSWITGTVGTDIFSQPFPASQHVYFSIGP